MAKPYRPTFEITIRRKFDDEIEGERTWRITSEPAFIDRLEDAISFMADNAMSEHIPGVGKGAVPLDSDEAK